jgi:hypothetical protein
VIAADQAPDHEELEDELEEDPHASSSFLSFFLVVFSSSLVVGTHNV